MSPVQSKESSPLNLLIQLRRREHGNAMIEFALVLPIMVLMLLGAMDFGILLNQDLRVADSARSAAEAATLRANATNLTLLQQIGTASAAGIPGYAITATNFCTCANGTGSVSCSSHTNCGSYGTPNQYVKVTATATLPVIFAIQSLPGSYKVQSVAIARTAWTGGN